MKAFYWLGFGIVFAALLASPLAGAAAPPPPPIHTWKLTVPSQVPLGDTLNIVVTGPRGQPFTLNFTDQPFNHSYPIYLFYYSLPPSRNNTTYDTSLNLSIPTDELSIGAYQIALSNSSGPLNFSLVRFILPVNVTQLSANVTALQELVNGFETQLQNFAAFLQNQNFSFWLLFSVAIGVSLGALVFEILRYLYRREKEAFYNAKRQWKKLWYEPQVHSYAVGAIHEYTPVVSTEQEKMGGTHSYLIDPDRYYRSDYCQLCRTAYFDEEEIVTHIQSAHFIPAPELNRDYYVDEEMYAYIQETKDQTTLSSSKLTSHHEDLLKLDLSDLGEQR
jgi:hypothetical protein